MHCCGVIIARITVSCPEIFEATAKDGLKFRCTESWVKKFVHRTLNWTFHRATRTAQKTPSNADQLCLDQFYCLTLTIHDRAIFIRLDTTLPTLRDRSLQWLINSYHAINKPDVVKQSFFQCKAGTTFNLSFKSLTSHEALHALHDVQKNDTMTWECIKMAQYKTPEADEEVEPPFMHAADVELDPSDVLVDTVLQHIALGESSVPHGYSADDLGNLLVDNESESYEQGVLDDMTGLQSMADGSTEVEAEGCGKRRRVANTQYKDFWMH
ncbi:hypothetical protein EDB19DRAFT_1392728 [Suillus lakei]|nr:hypothetical protein EDB19DRAFT_1392728 [Suillus lakei]